MKFLCSHSFVIISISIIGCIYGYEFSGIEKASELDNRRGYIRRGIEADQTPDNRYMAPENPIQRLISEHDLDNQNTTDPLENNTIGDQDSSQNITEEIDLTETDYNVTASMIPVSERPTISATESPETETEKTKSESLVMTSPDTSEDEGLVTANDSPTIGADVTTTSKPHQTNKWVLFVIILLINGLVLSSVIWAVYRLCVLRKSLDDEENQVPAKTGSSSPPIAPRPPQMMPSDEAKHKTLLEELKSESPSEGDKQKSVEPTRDPSSSDVHKPQLSTEMADQMPSETATMKQSSEVLVSDSSTQMTKQRSDEILKPETSDETPIKSQSENSLKLDSKIEPATTEKEESSP